MQTKITEQNSMINEIGNFFYKNVLEHFDFIGAIAFTGYSIHLVSQWEMFTIKVVVTAFLGSVGAITGWLTKVFVIYPLHDKLKNKFPNSVFFKKKIQD